MDFSARKTHADSWHNPMQTYDLKVYRLLPNGVNLLS